MEITDKELLAICNLKKGKKIINEQTICNEM